MNPANVSNLKQVGRSLMLLGKFRSSMEVLEEAKRLDPRDWEVWHDEGICNAKARSYEKAVEVREKEREVVAGAALTSMTTFSKQTNKHE